MDTFGRAAEGDGDGTVVALEAVLEDRGGQARPVAQQHVPWGG